MGRQSHNNPWADRLQEVSIPEAGEAWKEMETILNREMPGVGKTGRFSRFNRFSRIRWTRWFPFTLSTVLLTGFVCYVWFGRHPHTALHQPTQSSPAAASRGRTAAAPLPARPGDSSSGVFPSSTADSPAGAGSGPGLSPDPTTLSLDRTATLPDRTATPRDRKNASPASTPRSGPVPRSTTALSLHPARHYFLRPTTHPIAATPHRRTRTASVTHSTGQTAAGSSAGSENNSDIAAGRSTLAATGASGSSATPAQTTGAPPTRRHGLHLSDPGKIRSPGIPPSIAIGRGMVLPKWKPDPIPSKQKTAARSRSNSPLTIKNTGWKLGVGFNQGVAVSGQQAWNHYNVGSINNPLLDYIPVPTISYYFQPKLYVQAEARFHAPQYTQKNLGFQYTDNDSSGLLTGFVYVEKLFYFQLPVSVHYSPLPHWSVGLGLQYSRYEKGIGFAQYTGGAKPVSLGKYKSLSIDHNDFRGLVSLDYTFRNWVVGISYDQAFNRFIHTQTSASVSFNSQTLARNSAVQISLRYTLWDSRRKRSPAK